MTALAAGLILAVTGTVVYQWQRRPPATSTTPPSTTAAAPPPAPRWVSALTLAKADIHVSPDDALAFRGAADTLEPSAVDLAAALAPYRQDDFAEAAGRLRPLLDRYPRSPRVGLYLGVSLLFLGRHEDAVGPLEVGLTATDPAVANDARWFLVVAYARAGRLDLAEPRLRALCAAAVDRARPACAALGAGQEQGPR